ncbi:MAG: BolA family protein [Ferruginibacter sp.]
MLAMPGRGMAVISPSASVSTAFTGKTLIQRHRLIYAAVADLMHRDIHALSISKAQSLDEV